jgi:large subunit ribosomal protein L13
MTTTFKTTTRETAAWHVVDASQETLGRMAARIAHLLQGKHKPTYTPHADVGDFVVVVNAKDVRVTGRKRDDKVYRRYTGYHGGLVTEPYQRLLDRRPTDIVRLAVKRMMPKTRLGRAMLSKLKVVAGAEHRHHAQAPKPLSFRTVRSAAAPKKTGG